MNSQWDAVLRELEEAERRANTLEATVTALRETLETRERAAFVAGFTVGRHGSSLVDWVDSGQPGYQKWRSPTVDEAFANYVLQGREAETTT